VALAARLGIRYIGIAQHGFLHASYPTSNVDELIQLVAQRAGITPSQAEHASPAC
jgi:hypothetical protein